MDTSAPLLFVILRSRLHGGPKSFVLRLAYERSESEVVVQRHIEPEGQSFVGGDRFRGHRDPARTHAPPCPHLGPRRPGRLSQLVVSLGSDSDEQIAAIPGTGDHLLVHHERPAPEHRHLTGRWLAGEQGANAFDQLGLLLRHRRACSQAPAGGP